MMSETQAPGFSFKRIVPLAVILIAAVAGFFLLKDFLTFDALAENRTALEAWRDQNYLVAVLAFIAVYVAVVAFSLPGASVMTLGGGFLFALFPGVIYIVLSATIGATAIFLAAKTGLGDALHKKLESGNGAALLKKMDEGLHKNEVSYLFLMRLVPAIPFFVANLAPAFLGVKLRNYVATTFLGIIPGSLVYTSVGAGLGEVFDRGETPNLGIIFEWHILGPILGLCALAALPILISKFRKEG